MALGVPHVGGKNTSSGAGVTATSDAWTSTSNSLIVVIGHHFNTAGSSADGDVTDSNSNTYHLVTSLLGGGASGIAVWYNNAGTRGASHTVSLNGPGTAESNKLTVIEVTGQDLTTPLDSTTFATNNDGSSPFAVTAAASISGNQIAIYGSTNDTNGGPDGAWTPPGGYTGALEWGSDSTGGLVFFGGYKINETGTPTVSGSWGGTTANARQVFVTFKEAVGGGPAATPIVTFRRRQQPITATY